MHEHFSGCGAAAAARGWLAGAGLLALAALVPTGAFAQSAALEGSVTDAQGGALAGAVVTAAAPGMEPVSAATDSGGMYRFAMLAPGTYALTVEMSGFRTERRAALELGAGETLSVDVRLGLAPFAQQVDVIGIGPSPGSSVSRDRVPATVAVVTAAEIEDRQAASLAGRAQRAARLGHAGGRHRQPVPAKPALPRIHRLGRCWGCRRALPCIRTAPGSTSPSATRCSST